VIQVNTERAIRHAIQDRLPIVVVINKVNLSLSKRLSMILLSINHFVIEQ
jgi:translation elongation factor EF-G